MERRVLVTGANSGIGAATVVRLARIGFSVYGSARSEEKAGEIERMARQEGVHVEPVVFDLIDQHTPEEVVAGLDLWALVNNAGFFNAGAIEDVPPEAARDQLEAMVVAPMRLAKAALPAMRRRGEGRIVNVGSVTSRANAVLTGWYQACKHALAALNDALRVEVEQWGVEVVLLEPGAFDTAIWDRAIEDLERCLPGSRYATQYQRALDLIELGKGRVQDPDEVAQTVEAALTVGRPHPRYVVGVDAPVLELLYAMAPRRVADRVLQRAAGF